MQPYDSLPRHDTYGVRREYWYFARLPDAGDVDALRTGLRDDISIVLLPGNGDTDHPYVRMTGVVGDFEKIRAIVRRLGGVLLPTAPKQKESASS
ncbi:MAG: hypothetical protein WCS85_03000 [Candidatus Peribacteraceae bacterium]